MALPTKPMQVLVRLAGDPMGRRRSTGRPFRPARPAPSRRTIQFARVDAPAPLTLFPSEPLLHFLFGKAASAVGPVETAFDAMVSRGLYLFGMVEGTDRHVDQFVAVVLEVEGRLAVRTDAVRRYRRRPVRGG